MPISGIWKRAICN